jgi:hypothetical protein
VLLEFVMSVGRNSSAEHTHRTVELEKQGARVPPVTGLVPWGLDQDLGSPKSDGLDVLGKVLRGPARHSPVAQGDVELGNPRRVASLK